jgi:hypothetical protein
MPLIDLKTIPLVQARQRKPRRKRTPPPRVDLAATIRHLAGLIDPGAFADELSPTRETLEADLAHAKREIVALREEIEWISAVPTDPIGEYRRIDAERTEQERRNTPLQVKRIARHERLLEIGRRRQAAIAKAKLIFDECKKVLGRRNTLVVIKGRFITRKGGL